MFDFLVGVAVVYAVWYALSKLPSNKCNNNCDQGRSCNCQGK